MFRSFGEFQSASHTYWRCGGAYYYCNLPTHLRSGSGSSKRRLTRVVCALRLIRIRCTRRCARWCADLTRGPVSDGSSGCLDDELMM